MIQPLIAPLNEVITNEDVQPLLASPEIIQALLPLLPEGQQTEEELRATIRKRGVRCDIQDVLGSNTLNDSYLFLPLLSFSCSICLPYFFSGTPQFRSTLRTLAGKAVFFVVVFWIH